MAIRVEVKCINKGDRQNIHTHITDIGGINPDGGKWKLSQAEAISGIEINKYEFFVRRGGAEVEVIVALSQYNNKYLKTVADGLTPDNLLSLPECP